MAPSRYYPTPTKKGGSFRGGGGGSRPRRGCAASSLKLIILAPVLAAAALFYLVYFRFVLRHAPAWGLSSKWKRVRVAADAAPPLPIADENTQPQVPEFSLPTDLYRVAAAGCFATPACLLAVVLSDCAGGTAAVDTETPLALTATYLGRQIPIALVNGADTHTLFSSAGPQFVTCPSPDGAAWLILGGVRWKLTLTGGPTACGSAAPAPGWVSCDWLQRRPRGPDIDKPAKCAFGRGSIVAATHTLDASALPLLALGGIIALVGAAPDPAFRASVSSAHASAAASASGRMLSELQRIAKIPSPGDGVQHSVGVWALTDSTDTTASSSASVLDGPTMSAAFEALRSAPAFSVPSVLDPLVAWAPCEEWPAAETDTQCAPRPFSVFDHLLAVRSALLLAHWHRYRVVLPAMLPPIDELAHGDETHHDSAPGGTFAAVHPLAFVDLSSLTVSLTGTVSVIDTQARSVKKLGWSTAREGLGADATYAATGGDMTAPSAVLHGILRKYGAQNPQKLVLSPCPLGLVGWEPAKIPWHGLLWHRITAAMEPPARVAALRDAFQRELLRQSGGGAGEKRSAASRQSRALAPRLRYNAVDLRDFLNLQARCKCLLRRGDSSLLGGKPYSHELLLGRVDCGLTPGELVETLSLTLGFERNTPLFVAMDAATAGEVMPALSSVFSAIVTVGEVLGGLQDVGLSASEALLLEAAIAEDAVLFAGQSLSAQSFHVKARRTAGVVAAAAATGSHADADEEEGAETSLEEPMRGGGFLQALRGGARTRADRLLSAVADAAAADAAAGVAESHRALVWGAAGHRPSASFYFDRSDPTSCAAPASPAAVVAAEAAAGGGRGGTAWPWPCPVEVALWLTL